MNRKNVTGGVILTIVVLAMIIIPTIAYVNATKEKDALQEILSEKENIISDMETRQLELQKDLSNASSNIKKLDQEKKNLHQQIEEDQAAFDEEKRKLNNTIEVLQKQKRQLENITPSTPTVSRGSSPVQAKKEFHVTATAYTAFCNGCSGTTATGIDLRANPNAKVVAVDPNVIPLGSKVWVEGYGNAIAGDTGGAIKGNKIDVFIPNENEMKQWGRKHNVLIKVLN